MKLNDAIRMADALRTNAVERAQKIVWINELEMKIQSLILHTAPDDMLIYTEEDGETEMLVPRPFDKVYYLWLAAMIDYGNAEYDKYQNDKAMADAAYSDYAKWFMRLFHEHGCGKVLYIGGTTKYGLSAYQIACNHGFEGTEEEWVESLRGEDGEDGKDAYTIAKEKGYEGTEEEFYAQLGLLSALEEQMTQAVSDTTASAAAAAESAEAAQQERVLAEYAESNAKAWAVGGKVVTAVDPETGLESFTLSDGAKAYAEAAQTSAGAAAYSAERAQYAVTQAPEIRNGTWWVYDQEQGEYVNTGVKAQGEDGTPGQDGADGKDAVLFVQADEPTDAKVGDLWFDTDEEVTEPSGGASSWNDLTDKPFGETYGDTLTWDGDTTNRACFDDYYFYRVSDSVPSLAELSAGGTFFVNDEALETFTSDDISFWDGVVDIGGFVAVLDDEAAAVHGVPSGTYFFFDGPNWVSSFTINGYTGFLGVKKIEEKFLPDSACIKLFGDKDRYLYDQEDTSDTSKRITKAQLLKYMDSGKTVYIDTGTEYYSVLAINYSNDDAVVLTAAAAGNYYTA